MKMVEKKEKKEKGKYAFVTVGSTSFDGLIEYCSKHLLSVLAPFGFGNVLLQIGRGEFVPSGADCEEISSSSSSSCASFETGKTYFYRFKASLASDVADASLIISHAGAGSIFEALRQDKVLCVVSNDQLMNKHQSELAEHLAAGEFLWHAANPSSLASLFCEPAYQEVLRREEREMKALKAFPFDEEASSRFDSYLKKEVLQREQWGKSEPIRTLCVLGSGGHTTEMMGLLKKVRTDCDYRVTWVLAESDKGSEAKVEQRGGGGREERVRIYRAREVGQAWSSTVLTTLWAFVQSVYVVLRVAPQLVLTNGPGTCIPIALAAVLLSSLRFWIFVGGALLCVVWAMGITVSTVSTWMALGTSFAVMMALVLYARMRGVKVVYVESICRVEHLSLSAKILKLFTPHLLVQWEKLARKENIRFLAQFV